MPIYLQNILSCLDILFIFPWNSGNYPGKLVAHAQEPKIRELSDEQCLLKAITE